MTQLTVRGFDDRLVGALRELARKRGISLSKAALMLMRKGCGLDDEVERSDVVGSSLDHLIGTWTEEDEEEFLEAIASCEEPDPELWQ